MKVVVLGKGLMLANIILGIKDSQVAEIAGVFRYDYTNNSKLKMFFRDIFNQSQEVSLIKELKIPQIKLKSANSEEFRKLLIKLNVDLIIVGTWKELLEPQTFNIPKIAAINVHPSLLPEYRGPNPYLQTILNGEEYSGVTIHLIDKNYDTGAILKQEKIPIYENDTSKELRQRTVIKARELVKNTIIDLNSSILTPVSQNEKLSSYYPNITGEERMLDFSTQSSKQISRTIRALHPFLPCYITYKNSFYIVDPYNFKILDENYYEQKPASIISDDLKHKSLTIVCCDKKAIQFFNLKHYKKYFLF